MNELWIHPALILLIGAVLLPLVPLRLRSSFLLLVPLLVFIRVYGMAQGVYGEVTYLTRSIVFGRVDALASLFGYIMALMAFIGTLYGLKVRRNGELAAAWVYVAGALGAIYAGDLLTLFLFWELMAFSSVFLIWFRGRKQSLAAGYRYLLVHAVGGIFLLAGILLYSQGVDSLVFDGFNVARLGLGEWFILIGFLLNAAVPPLHAWCPDGYGEATFSGSVFLCAFTTKTAVYVLIRGFAGLEILIWWGVIMALYGVVYAALENDCRRLLAYHIISQVGYMVAGVGIGTQLAINGVCAHAFAHILYKGLLFMGCGAVLHMTGQSKFTELGGLYHRMPWTFVFTLIGGLSISAFPLFSGFVSKSMTVQAGLEAHFLWPAFLLILASSGTFLSTGLKIPYFIWFGKNNCRAETWERAADPPWNMRAAMAFTAVLCIFIGVYTPYLYTMLPYPVDYHPYTSYHVSESMQVLMFTLLAFFLLLKKLQPKAAIAIDADWFYRCGAAKFYRCSDWLSNGLNSWGERFFAHRLPALLARFFNEPGGNIQLAAMRLITRMTGADTVDPGLEHCILHRSRLGTYPVGLGVLLAVLFLTGMSLLYFFF